MPADPQVPDGDRTRPRRRWGAVAALLAGALALAGCTSPKNQSDASERPPITHDVPAELSRFYEQQVEWTECGDLECATVEVPLDWEDPEGDVITLAVNRSRATGADVIGSLLTNPGGPGGSGVEALEGIVMERVGKEIAERYDIVGFDPRGVAGSQPVACVDGEQMDEIVSADPDYSTEAGVQEAEDRFGALGEACLQNTGELLEHVDTVSAARDMDVLRAVLGDETLTYLGYSYGTQLGATYAALYPEKVGRMVLDGALDPTLSADELAQGQAVGFESALRAYVEDCRTGAACPLTGSVEDGMAQVKKVLDRARRNPIPTDDPARPLTGSLAFSGIAQSLYAPDLWPWLTRGLQGALANDGSTLLFLADFYYDRQDDGTYASNSTEAFWAINCADDRSPSDLESMKASAAEIEAAAPTIGYYFSYGGVVCAQWPVPEAGGLDSYAAEGAAPILVIGTTNDPATPYAWAESLSALLSSGVLLTYEGEGHTAYGRSNECVDDAVDTYLLTGEAPADGTRC